MTDNTNNNEVLIIKDVEGYYLNIFEKGTFKGKETSYGGVFILDPEKHSVFIEKIKNFCKNANISVSNQPLKSEDLVSNPKPFQVGKYTLKTSSRFKPKAHTINRDIVTNSSDWGATSGDLFTIVVKLGVMKSHEFPSRVMAYLVAVKHNKIVDNSQALYDVTDL